MADRYELFLNSLNIVLSIEEPVLLHFFISKFMPITDVTSQQTQQQLQQLQPGANTTTGPQTEFMLAGLRIAILAADGFEQVELTEPRKALEESGAVTRLISIGKAPIRGLHHDQPGDMFDVDATFETVHADEFDAVLLPGGEASSRLLAQQPAAQKLVQSIDKEGKPLAVICHGPLLLVASGLVQGKKMSSAPNVRSAIENAGGHWQNAAAVVDGNWVSSRTPADIPAFIEAFKKLLAIRTRESVKGTPDDMVAAAGTGG